MFNMTFYSNDVRRFKVKRLAVQGSKMMQILCSPGGSWVHFFSRPDGFYLACQKLLLKGDSNFIETLSVSTKMLPKH